MCPRRVGILHEERGFVAYRVEHEALDGIGRQRAALEVVVRLTAEHVATALGHRADHTAERAAVFCSNAARLHLHFLEVFEDGVLARLTVDETVGDDPIDSKRVFRAAGTRHLKAAFNFARVDRRCGHGD